MGCEGNGPWECATRRDLFVGLQLVWAKKANESDVSWVYRRDLVLKTNTYLLCLEVKPVGDIATSGLYNRDAQSTLAITVISKELRQIVNTQEEGDPTVVV